MIRIVKPLATTTDLANATLQAAYARIDKLEQALIDAHNIADGSYQKALRATNEPTSTGVAYNIREKLYRLCFDHLEGKCRHVGGTTVDASRLTL